jgi:hypothetical protein
MNPRPEWLPLLVELADYGGNWKRYEEALYGFFRADFIASAPQFRGQRVGLKRHPMIQGKEATYWHCISEGKVEDDRLPDLRRCERIRWPRPCIEHEAKLKVWTEERNGEDRIHLWLEAESYAVVLAVRRGYVILWTTIFVKYDHERRKFTRRFEDARKRLMPPRGTAS